MFQSPSTGGLERLIYDVKRGMKGKANRKEHAQHQRRTLSCGYIFLFLTPSICPVATVGPPDVYKNTGLSPSVIAHILRGSFTSDQAVSRHTLLTSMSFLATVKYPYQCVQENIKDIQYIGRFS